ncbi:MAG: hypothetical protein IJ486_01525 [Firmicutes bacterium]|nr:hypothetical protein [Bacillota bacterium]
MNERSNLTDFQIYSTETKSELANLVDRQLEARGVCGYAFDEKEVNRTWERELLGPKFYYHLLEDCGLDFWMVFKYAAHHLRAELDEKSQGNHPVGVEKLFTILTGEEDFKWAVKQFFVDVYPTHGTLWATFQGCSDVARGDYPLQPIKEYFIFELTDEKLQKLEIVMENFNAMKEERFKLFDQFEERRDGNMEKVRRIMESMGEDEAKKMIFPLLLNELRVNPSDIFRYFYRKDICRGMAAEKLGWGNEDKIEYAYPLNRSENYETFLKMTGVISYFNIFAEDRNKKNLPKFNFWSELTETMRGAIPDHLNIGGKYFNFIGLDDGAYGNDNWGKLVVSESTKELRRNFYQGHFREEPFFLVSGYGGEATKNRLDAIFTPEVLKVIWRDYGQFVFAPEKKNVEKELKRLGIIDGAGEEKPSKKGLFGLFRK